ncbi:MAG: hypothetical protein BWY42_01480 [Candidatus Omnitrophica bacterium ADurb.Bin277]|nr:MAG: hypothetical protein BWY42_01480 [Candidatus Omnitrophica bacterium ADurb.Bin277]
MTLEDFRWLDPDNLDGASGKVGGHIRFRRTGDQAPFFEMTLDAPDPGGSLQAKFFDLFLPYLPASVQRKRVEKLAGRGERLVRFKTADLKVEMPEGDRMKVLLHILVLDYNLKLQLSMEVRTDSENALLKIARWMGVVEVKL